MEKEKKGGLGDILWLFLIFVKVGTFTFGSGISILAQLEKEFIDKRGRVTREELLDDTTVGKSLPGIMITNVSMLMAYRLAGIAGGVAAVFGLTLPAVVILSLVTRFYSFFEDNYWFEAAMKGVSAAVVAIVLYSTLSLAKEAFREKIAIMICLAAFLLSMFTPVSNILLIVAGVVGALVWLGAERAVKKP